MQWTYLGHAGWLVEVGGHRLLMDPQLGETHHDGVFEVFPRRKVHADLLRPDVILITHRHPDHFDVPSLAKLAQLDPSSVVITPDALIAGAAEALGFRHICQLGSSEHLDLGGARIYTTPSIAPVEEWGLMVAGVEGVAWNQVDTGLRDPAHVQEVLQAGAAALDRPELTEQLDLGIVRWHPIQQIEAPLSRHVGFPHRGYAQELERIAALNAKAVLPGSAGVRHVGPHAWLNRYAYPVPERRVIRDSAQMCPQTRTLAPLVGHTYRLTQGQVSVTPSSEDLLTLLPREDDRRFAPCVELPPLTDPNRSNRDQESLFTQVEAWVHHELAPALERVYPRLQRVHPWVCVLQVVGPDDQVCWTLTVDTETTSVQKRFEPDYDQLNCIAASELVAVIRGESHWGRPLLGGLLRAVDRFYRVRPQGLSRPKVAPLFLYYALSYDQATVRWTQHLVHKHLSTQAV